MKHFLFILAFLLLATTFICRAGVNDTVWTRYTQSITKVQFSHDDNTIMTVGNGGLIFFSTLSGEQIQHIYDGDGEYSDDGNLIVGCKQVRDSLNHIVSYNINIYDAKTYSLIKSFAYQQLASSDVAVIKLSPDAQTVALGTRSEMYFIDLQTGIIKKHLTSFGNETNAVRIIDFLFTKDNKDLIITLSDPIKGSYGEMMYINTSTYQMDYRNDLTDGGLAISEDGSMLAYQSETTGIAVEIANTQTHSIIQSIPGHYVGGFKFSPDGQYLATTAGYYLDCNIWFLPSLQKVYDYHPETQVGGGGLQTVDISSDLKYLVGASGPYLFLYYFSSVLGIQPPTINQPDVLYPNPTTNSVIIKTNCDLPTINFQISNIAGQTLLSSTVLNQNNEAHFDFSLFPNGSYILNIVCGKTIQTYKVIKEN